jgi:hypothetical protein
MMPISTSEIFFFIFLITIIFTNNYHLLSTYILKTNSTPDTVRFFIQIRLSHLHK